MSKKSVRLLSVLTLWASLAFLAPPAVQLVHASASCACGGYVYAYDYVPVYYTYEGERPWSGFDPSADDSGYCFNECYHYATAIGDNMCSTYSLGGGKGFFEPDFTWSFDNGLSGGHYYGVQHPC